MNNVIINLARKYKKDNNFSKIINTMIKDKLIENKITNNKYLTDTIEHTYSFTYFFNPFNIFYFINHDTNSENIKEEYKILKKCILEVLNTLGIYNNEKFIFPKSLQNRNSNLETYSTEVNDCIWDLSVLLLKPKIKSLYNSIKNLETFFNISKVFYNSTKFNFREISIMMYCARPDKFFPRDKYTENLFLRYSNYFFRQEDLIKEYLRYNLNTVNRFNRELLVNYSQDDDSIYGFTQEDKGRILDFLYENLTK